VGKGRDSLNLDEFGSASVISVMTKHHPQPWRVHDVDNPVKYLKAWHVLDVEKKGTFSFRATNLLPDIVSIQHR